MSFGVRLFLSLLLMTGLAVLTSSAVHGQPALLASKVVPDGLGVNIKRAGMTPAEFDKIAAAGIRVLRFDLHWDVVEKTPGVYDFSTNSQQDFDHLVAQAQQRGMTVMFILCYGHPNYDAHAFPHTDQGRAAFARYAAAAARHFAGKPVFFEVWNEPNFPSVWGTTTLPEGVTVDSGGADLYAQLAHVTIDAMRAANPDVVIVGPGISGPGVDHTQQEREAIKPQFDYLRTIAASGAMAKFDAITLHPYRAAWPESIHANLDQVRALLKEYNVEKPLICGEMGWPTWLKYGFPGGEGAWAGNGNLFGQLTLDQQAAYFVRLYLTNVASNVPVTIWYLWPEEVLPTQAADSPDGMGMIDRAGNAKPVYRASVHMSRTLGGLVFQRRIAHADPGVWLMEFTSPQGTEPARRVVVAWIEDQNQAARTRLLARLELPGTYRASDLFGNAFPEPVAPTSGLLLTTRPMYLVPVEP